MVKYPGLTIFLLFFGVALLDALRGGHWVRALFWIGMGVLFATLERGRRARGAKVDGAPH